MTTRFVDGTVGSQSQVAQAFDELRTQGQDAINKLVILRENTLLLFSNALSGLNGKRIRANRLPEVGVTSKLVVSDLQDINQSITTASVRADSNSISLRERTAPGEAIVNQVRFSASEGTIQALQVPGSSSAGNLGALYRVATQGGSTPVGTFDIQLLAPVSISLLIFDMIDTPSTAMIQAFTSQNGISFTEALSVTRNGYRLAAWMKPEEAKFLRITITPALPDILGGSVFTFGLTDLHAFAVQYHLRSDAYTNQIEIEPHSLNLLFSTASVPGLLYFLSLAGNPPIEVFPGDVIPVPGASQVTLNKSLIAHAGSAWIAAHAYSISNQIIDSNGNLQTVVSISGTGTSGLTHPVWSINGGQSVDNPGVDQIIWQETAWAQLNHTLPGDVYLSTLVITDHGTGESLRLAPGLDKTTIGVTNQYFAVKSDGTIYLLIYNAAVDQTRTFDISYVAGPTEIIASLQVELTTNDLNTTPIYSGAELIEA